MPCLILHSKVNVQFFMEKLFLADIFSPLGKELNHSLSLSVYISSDTTIISFCYKAGNMKTIFNLSVLPLPSGLINAQVLS